MSIDIMNAKIKGLREPRRMADELAGEIESLQDEMTAREVDALTGIDWKITWKAFTSSRLDGKALKAAMPDVSAQFTRETTSRRSLLA